MSHMVGKTQHERKKRYQQRKLQKPSLSLSIVVVSVELRPKDGNVDGASEIEEAIASEADMVASIGADEV